MYGRFLEESADITGDGRLAEIGKDMRSIGNIWQEVAGIFKRGSEMSTPGDVLAETTAPLMELADMEESAWTRLRDIVR
jgi:hypothetical protein